MRLDAAAGVGGAANDNSAVVGVDKSSDSFMSVALTTSQQNLELEGTEAGSTATKLRWYKFDNVRLAQGYNALGMSRGALVMTNIFLSTSLIFLASKEAGCLNEAGDAVVEDCQNEIYGFKPASFVSNIAIISGVLSALFMPIFGAMIDYTEHRRTVGIAVAVLIMMIHAVQIGTVSSTWFYMAILQAFAGFLYQIEVLATYAYLPDMARTVGGDRMIQYTATFVMTQFGAQAFFLVVVIAISYALGLDDVKTSQFSQALDTIWSSSLFYIGWRLLPAAPKNHTLPEGKSLLTQGFVQVYHTTLKIHRDYSHGLQWFFLALICAESAANAFTVVSVIYLDQQKHMSSSEIGIFFLLVLICTLPGSKLATAVTCRLFNNDPKKSWQLNMLCLTGWTAGGAIALDYVPVGCTYIWGAGIGVLLGWFYPTENVFFSMCLPKHQEAELSGFFVYCTQILGWLPPLIFTLLVESDVSQTYAVVSISGFFLLAIALLHCAAPWNDILKESGRSEEVEATIALAPGGVDASVFKGISYGESNDI